MGSAVSIGLLIIDSSDMLEGNSESVGGSGCEALDDLPGLEVLALLVGRHRTELSRREVVAPSVVGGLLVSYMRWGAGEEGLVGAPPLESGIYGAFVAWNGESRGTRVEKALCLGVRLGEGAGRASRVHAILKMEGGPRVHARRGLGVRLFEVRCVGRGVEWRGMRWHFEEMRLQGGRGKWGIHNDRGACKIGKLGLEGLKKDGRVSFGFRIACEMALGVWNGSTDPLGFCTVFRTMLGVRKKMSLQG